MNVGNLLTYFTALTPGICAMHVMVIMMMMVVMVMMMINKFLFPSSAFSVP